MSEKPTLVPRVPKDFPKTATFPPPERFLVQDSPTNPRGAQPFFEYWKRIAGTRENPAERADLVTVKFYLHIPVVTYKMVDPSRKNAIFKTVEGPLWFENPEDYETEVPKLLGAARWHVLINEAGVHGHLMHCYFQAGSWDDYPLIIDLNTLVRTEPKNADYIQWLKKNKIRTPWDNPEDEEQEMANDTLNVVANVLERQADAVISATKEVAEVRVQAAQDEVERIREESSDRVDKRESAEAQGIKLVTEIAKESGQATLAMARDMVAMSREDRRPEVNTLEILTKAVELVRPQGDQSSTTMFVQAIKDMQTSNQEFIRSIVGMTRNPDGSWSAPQQGPKSGGFEEEVVRFQRMADIFGYQKPGAVTVRDHQPEAPPREPEKSLLGSIAENIVPFCTMATTVVTLVANLIYNLRAEPGKATSPQEALQKVAAQPNPVQQQTQQQSHVNPKDPAAWAPFAKHLFESGCLRAHFWGADQQMNGYTFAEFILSNFTGGGTNEQGRKNYGSILENLGRKGFDAMIRAYPQLWDIVKDTPQQYETFLDEFFGYDEMIRAQQNEGAAA